MLNIFTEFQPLEEVILGTSYDPGSFDCFEDKELVKFMDQILFETQEDIEILEKMLTSLGVKVKRPKNQFILGAENKKYFCNLQHFGFTFPNHPLMPRDTTIVYNNKIIETFTGSPGRYFENWAYREIFNDYFINDEAKWFSMPMPILNDNKSYSEYNNTQILYHAANFSKVGTHIFYSRPGNKTFNGKGTDIGLEWVKRSIPEATFIECPCDGHMDGKMAFLKPGVVATWGKKFLPEILKSWNVIELDDMSGTFPENFKKIKKKRFYDNFVKEWLTHWIGYVDETVFDVNMFSVSENLVITNGYNKRVYDQFKLYGIEGIPWNFRHQYFWDGAIHCLTLDIKRSGSLENYF